MSHNATFSDEKVWPRAKLRELIRDCMNGDLRRDVEAELDRRAEVAERRIRQLERDIADIEDAKHRAQSSRNEHAERFYDLRDAARALLDKFAMCDACNSFAIGQCERGTKSATGWVYRVEWACSKHMGVELPNGPDGEWADAAEALGKLL